MKSTIKKTDNTIASFTEWVAALKKQNSFSASIDYFVKTANFPILYFEYQDSKAWLSLKKNSNLVVEDFLCLRLHESGSVFNPIQLYKPKQIPLFHSYVQRLFGTQKYQCFPLIFNRKVVAVFAYLSDSILVEDQLFILNSYIKDFLWREKWERDSSVDDLTGCLNKKAFLKQLFIEISRARRLQLPLSLILLQLDQFETLESEYGSYKANIFIKSLVNNLIKDSRSYDLFGCWPTGQIGVILPHTSERGAGMKVEKIRWSVQSADFSKVFPSHAHLTISLGLSEYPRVSRSAESLFHSTLKALSFAGKECSGNMTAVATPPVGFKPDFSVQSSMNNLRDLT